MYVGAAVCRTVALILHASYKQGTPLVRSTAKAGATQNRGGVVVYYCFML